MDPDRDTLDLSSDQEAKTAPVFRQALFFSKKQNESFVQLALLTHLGEALAAIDRTVGLGLKGNLGLAAAGSANSGEVLGDRGQRSCERHGRPCSAGARSGSRAQHRTPAHRR